MRHWFTVQSQRLQAYFPSPRRGALLSASFVLVLLVLTWWQAGLWYQTRLLAEQRAQLMSNLIPVGNALTKAINRRFALLEGLKAFTEVELNTPDAIAEGEFKIFAAGLYASAQGIRNFSVAPRGVQRYVYPLAGNEKVPGHDLIHDERPNVRADVQRAIQLGEISLSGPYELRQGGLGLVARQAVYQDGAFWGLVCMVLDMPPVFDEAGLGTQPASLNPALRDGSGQVFYGQSAIFETDPIIYHVELPEGSWELAGVPIEGWHSSILEPLVVFRGAGMAIVGLITGVVYLVTNRRVRLTLIVRQRTREISRINEELAKELTERKQVEEALRISAQQWHTTFDAISDAVSLMDLEGRTLRCNEALTRLLGKPFNEISGCTCWELVHGTSEPIEGCPVVRMQETLCRETLVLPIGDRWFSVVVDPLLDEDGSLIGAVHIIRDITERKRAEETIKQMAYHDDLTGLPNRRLFNDRLDVALAHAHRNQQKLAVMLLDLDHFKDVNDTLGHSVGDQLLRDAGKRLTSLLRKGDTAARMGGDEFMLLLPEIAGGEDAARIAQKVLEAFREPFVLNGHELHTTTSIGIALYPEDGEDADTLMKDADIAMYRAKDEGRDTYQCYTLAE